MGGARIPPHAFTVAPTPPPDVDVAAWERSIATIRGWEPAALGMTHFGVGRERLEPARRRAWRRSTLQVELEAEHDEAGFVAVMEERVREGCAEDAEAMIRATPLDQLHMGLARWRAKHT